MNVIDGAIVFARNLPLSFIYCCSHCVRFFFEYIISWTPFIWGAANGFLTVYQTLLLIPFHIIIKVGLQLCLLPVNLPLRVLLGTSIKDILLQATNRSDAYIFTAILQYCLVLAIYGVSIGGLCGTFLSVINTLWRIPDIYVEIPVKFWKYMHAPLWVKKSLLFYNGAITQLYGKDTKCNDSPSSPPLASSSQPPEPSQFPISVELTESELATPKSGADFTLRPKPHSASRESILKVASILPSDFFQQDQREKNFYEENQQYSSPSRSQSSQLSTQDSNVEFTNLWDKIEDSPITLRTEDGLTNLSRRKNLLDANSNEKLTTK